MHWIISTLLSTYGLTDPLSFVKYTRARMQSKPLTSRFHTPVIAQITELNLLLKNLSCEFVKSNLELKTRISRDHITTNLAWFDWTWVLQLISNSITYDPNLDATSETVTQTRHSTNKYCDQNSTTPRLRTRFGGSIGTHENCKFTRFYCTFLVRKG